MFEENQLSATKPRWEEGNDAARVSSHILMLLVVRRQYFSVSISRELRKRGEDIFSKMKTSCKCVLELES